MTHATEMVVVAVSIAASVCDLRTRKIPNVLTFGGAFAALLYGVVTGGGWGLLDALGGWAVGCALFLPWFLLGGMGAGDVKLVAALGAWVGPSSAVWLALYAGLAGGPLAVAVSLARGYLRESFSNLWHVLMFWRVAGIQPVPNLTLQSANGPRLPYALPIAVGAVMVIWLR